MLIKSKVNKLDIKHKLGILLISLSTLLLEFTFIRVLSVSLWYHFAFMIISIALLGFGISGIVLSLYKKLLTMNVNTFTSFASLLYSISVVAVFYIVNIIPFDPFSLLIDSSQFIYMPLYYILMIIPFFLSGIIIGRLFTSFKERINEIYFFDLVGAGLSCIVFIIVMPKLGGSGGILTASLIGLISFFIFNINNKIYKTFLLMVSIFFLLIISYFYSAPESYLPIRISENKIYGNYMKEYEPLRILTEWNAISRVDVIEDDDPPSDDYPVYIAIIDAGNSTTNIPRVPEVKDSLNPPFDASNLAMILKKDTANVFIIGSGGGGEILSALAHNASSVTAVEINGLLNDLITKNFASYWTKGLAANKKVKIITDDARGYLRSKRIKYDVIISAHTISASAVASGAMSLVENYIMTEEAVKDYMIHLKPDGIFYISRPESQLPRIVSSLIFANKELNKAIDYKNNFFIFKRPATEFEGKNSYLSGIVYKKDGFNEYDIQLLKVQTAISGLELVYDPVSKQEGIFNDLINSTDINAAINKYPFILEPATDDKPYFEHSTEFSKLNIDNLKEAFSQKDKAMVTLNQRPVAEVTLIFILIQLILLSTIFLLLPVYLRFRKDENIKNINKWKYLLYFGGLGLAYIMIEICLIQKFTLLLGQPVYTMLTVISGMLIFSGIGSAYSGKLMKILSDKYYVIFILIAVYTILLGFFNQNVFDLLVRSDISVRIIFSVILIAPLAFLMGIPFPSGFRLINEKTGFINTFSWAINGFFSVIGSVAVIILSMSFGFKFVFILTAIIYISLYFVYKKLLPLKTTH